MPQIVRCFLLTSPRPLPCAALTSAVAGVHDGYVLTKSISRSPVGGKLLNMCLQKALEARNIQVKPRQTFKRVEKKPGEFVVSLLCCRFAVPVSLLGV